MDLIQKASMWFWCLILKFNQTKDISVYSAKSPFRAGKPYVCFACFVCCVKQEDIQEDLKHDQQGILVSDYFTRFHQAPSGPEAASV